MFEFKIHFFLIMFLCLMSIDVYAQLDIDVNNLKFQVKQEVVEDQEKTEEEKFTPRLIDGRLVYFENYQKDITSSPMWLSIMDDISVFVPEGWKTYTTEEELSYVSNGQIGYTIVSPVFHARLGRIQAFYDVYILPKGKDSLSALYSYTRTKAEGFFNSEVTHKIIDEGMIENLYNGERGHYIAYQLDDAFAMRTFFVKEKDLLIIDVVQKEKDFIEAVKEIVRKIQF
ncbi:MAG: hypothetical protein ACOCRX_00640 [Candidatus Woesearchaeota archaeon]